MPEGLLNENSVLTNLPHLPQNEQNAPQLLTRTHLLCERGMRRHSLAFVAFPSFESACPRRVRE
jgi:hypothetical protein